MNRNGFTLVELLATLVVLGIIFGITVVSLNINFKETKGKTEEIFIETIEDALDMYLDSDAKDIKFESEAIFCANKTHGKVNLYKSVDTVKMNDVINSEFKPITKSELVNPNNEDVECSVDAVINIYRDEDYVYYYEIDKKALACLTSDGVITNLPSGMTEGGC